MDTYQHEDGHDHLAEEMRSSDHPGGGDDADQPREIGLPGIADGPSPTTVGEWARDESASGPVTETGTQPPGGKVLDPGVSETATDGG
jgi:hypothetical protein